MYYAFSRAEVQEPVRTEVVLPAFDYNVIWAGVSDLQASWDINNTTEFSFQRPIDAPNETFILCVAWENEDDVTLRYKFWEGGVLHYPIYDGERIGTSARLEVWSVELDHATLDDEFVLYSSWLTEPEICICTGGTAVATRIESTETITPGASTPTFGSVLLAIQGYEQLRTMTGYTNNQLVTLEFGITLGDALGGDFIFDSGETTADDNADYIKPNDLDIASPGRWVRSNNP